MSDNNEFFMPAARFDKEKAEDGVWYTVEDEHGSEYIKVKMILMDNGNPRWVARRDKWKRVNREGKDKEGYLRKMVAHVACVDWEINDGKGKPIPFSPDAAYRYFTQVPFAYEECVAFSHDVKNFVDADLGNS